MLLKGIEGLTEAQVRDEVRRGAKFLVFGYCMSFCVVTFKRASDITFVRAGQSAFAAHLPYTLLSLFLGWWGFPFGLVYTPMVVIENLAGGKDLTREVMSSFGDAVPPPQAPPVQVK